MSGVTDLWLAARKWFAERRAAHHLALSSAWTRTTRDCVERLRARARTRT